MLQSRICQPLAGQRNPSGVRDAHERQPLTEADTDLSVVLDERSGNSSGVFGFVPREDSPDIRLPEQIKPNCRQRMEGRKILSLLPEASIPAVFFDPQYRGILDKQKYGNEKESRGRKRSALPQMPECDIVEFIQAIDRILTPKRTLVSMDRQIPLLRRNPALVRRH